MARGGRLRSRFALPLEPAVAVEGRAVRGRPGPSYVRKTPMRGAVIHAPGDVRFETLGDPKILMLDDRRATPCEVHEDGRASLIQVHEPRVVRRESPCDPRMPDESARRAGSSKPQAQR